MSIDQRLRAGLAANTEHLAPAGPRPRAARPGFGTPRRRQARLAGVAVAWAPRSLPWSPRSARARSRPRVMDRPTQSKTPPVSLPGPQSMDGVVGAPGDTGSWVLPVSAQAPRGCPGPWSRCPTASAAPAAGWSTSAPTETRRTTATLAFHTVDYVMPRPVRRPHLRRRRSDRPGPGRRACIAQPGHRTTASPSRSPWTGTRASTCKVTPPEEHPTGRLRRLQATPCGAPTPTSSTPTGDKPGIVDHFWILDIDSTRVVMATPPLYPQPDQGRQQQVLAIAESTHFVDPSFIEPSASSP